MKSVNFSLLYGMGPETLWKWFIAQGHLETQKKVARIHRTWVNIQLPDIKTDANHSPRLF